jgi:nicotinamidase-related amidase
MSVDRIGMARRTDAVLVVVDVQEKLFPLMQEREAVERRLVMLVHGMRALGAPIIVTEQYVKGLGPTIPALRQAAAGARYVEKTTFSCFGDAGFLSALKATGRRQVVLCGIETHICVLQTLLGARAAGYEVFLVADAVAARLPHTSAIGIERARDAGACLASAEGILFECTERCDDGAFKEVLRLVREGV